MVYRFGAFELDEPTRALRFDGKEMALQPRVFDLLAYLVRNRERVVPKDELMASLWPDVTVGEGSLQRAVSLARGALERGGSGHLIRNYPRQGYRFVSLQDDVPAEGYDEKAPHPLAKAIKAIEENDWLTAIRELELSDRETPLAPTDLESFAEAAQRAGQSSLGIEPLERCVRAYIESKNRRGAARAATALAQIHLDRRELSIAKGWAGRVSSFLADEPPSREHGMASATASRIAVLEGDLDRAVTLAEEARQIGRSLQDPDVEALGLLYSGLSLVAAGNVHRGIALQDEAAAAVLGGGVSAWSGGLVYCGVIWCCLNRGDWRRASEWTGRLEGWCESQGLRSYTGLCRLHRAEVLGVCGELDRAEAEASEASSHMAESLPWAAGDALRVLGEIHLARGELDAAEAAFRRANELGWEPQPGWAMLQLARGRAEAAMKGLERALNDDKWVLRQRRGALLAHLAVAAARAGKTARAAEALSELDAHHELWSTLSYEALVCWARGELALAEGDRDAATREWRRSVQISTSVDARMSAAQVRLRLAEILLESDLEAAELEAEAAQALYRSVNAPVLAGRCDALLRRVKSRASPRSRDRARP